MSNNFKYIFLNIYKNLAHIQDKKLKLIIASKLMYFLQAWILCTYGKGAFDEEFETYLFAGVRVENISYDEMEELVKDCKFVIYELDEIEDIDKEIKFICDQFCKFSNDRLLNLIHSYSWWKTAWNSKSQLVSKETIHSFHMDKFKKEKQIF